MVGLPVPVPRTARKYVPAASVRSKAALSVAEGLPTCRTEPAAPQISAKTSRFGLIVAGEIVAVNLPAVVNSNTSTSADRSMTPATVTVVPPEKTGWKAVATLLP